VKRQGWVGGELCEYCNDVYKRELYNELCACERQKRTATTTTNNSVKRSRRHLVSQHQETTTKKTRSESGKQTNKKHGRRDNHSGLPLTEAVVPLQHSAVVVVQTVQAGAAGHGVEVRVLGVAYRLPCLFHVKRLTTPGRRIHPLQRTLRVQRGSTGRELDERRPVHTAVLGWSVDAHSQKVTSPRPHPQVACQGIAAQTSVHAVIEVGIAVYPGGAVERGWLVEEQKVDETRGQSKGNALHKERPFTAHSVIVRVSACDSRVGDVAAGVRGGAHGDARVQGGRGTGKNNKEKEEGGGGASKGGSKSEESDKQRVIGCASGMCVCVCVQCDNSC
jgi:hypothetical protein